MVVHCLTQVVVLEDVENGREGLLARDRDVGGRLDDRRLDEEPFAVHTAAATEDLATLLADGLERGFEIRHGSLLCLR